MNVIGKDAAIPASLRAASGLWRYSFVMLLVLGALLDNL